MRTHEADTPDFWGLAGAVVGLRGAWGAWARAVKLRASGAPMPGIPPRPKALQERGRVPAPRYPVWTDARLAELRSLLQRMNCRSAALEMGVTIYAAYNVLHRRSEGKAAPRLAPVPPGKPIGDFDANVAYAERAWAEHDKHAQEAVA